MAACHVPCGIRQNRSAAVTPILILTASGTWGFSTQASVEARALHRTVRSWYLPQAALAANKFFAAPELTVSLKSMIYLHQIILTRTARPKDNFLRQRDAVGLSQIPTT